MLIDNRVVGWSSGGWLAALTIYYSQKYLMRRSLDDDIANRMIIETVEMKD